MSQFLRIVPLASFRRYTSKRARRQAFYSSARTARALKRVVRQIEPLGAAAFERAYLDMIVTGTGAVEVQRDGGDCTVSVDVPVDITEMLVQQARREISFQSSLKTAVASTRARMKLIQALYLAGPES